MTAGLAVVTSPAPVTVPAALLVQAFRLARRAGYWRSRADYWRSASVEDLGEQAARRDELVALLLERSERLRRAARLYHLRAREVA